jgi:hypothetical protein
MSILGWLRWMRVDLFSSADHWADVMVEADALQSDHAGCAQEAAARELRAADGAQARILFRDVGVVLEGRVVIPPPRVGPSVRLRDRTPDELDRPAA